MKINERTLNAFTTIQVKGIDLTNFYAVKVQEDKVILMGNFSNSLLSDCKKVFSDAAAEGCSYTTKKPFALIDENNWVMGEYEINGVTIDITLT